MSRSAFNPQARRTDRERPIQQQIVTYCQRCCPDFYIFAVPNGGHRDPRTAAIMQSEGVRSGVADLVIMLPGGRTEFIEVKAPATYKTSSKTGKRVQAQPAGTLSRTQRDFQTVCDTLGHRYHVVYCLDDFMKLSERWKTG